MNDFKTKMFERGNSVFNWLKEFKEKFYSLDVSFNGYEEKSKVKVLSKGLGYIEAKDFIDLDINPGDLVLSAELVECPNSKILQPERFKIFNINKINDQWFLHTLDNKKNDNITKASQANNIIVIGKVIEVLQPL